GDAAYAAAFQWYGLDVEHGDVGEVAEYVRSRPIRKQLVAALDFWAALREREGQETTRLLAVARAADADKWRNQLRDAWERRDGKAIEDLLASADVATPPSGTLMLLESSSREVVFNERVASLLRRAQKRHPADVWINLQLAWRLHRVQPPHLEEVIRHCMIVVALRPQSQAAHVHLGVALSGQGRLDEAIDEFREAIRIKKDFAGAHNNLGDALREKGRL